MADTRSSSSGPRTTPYQSPLENLQREGSPNVVRTLLHRELRECYPKGSVLGKIQLMFDEFLLRQLLVARSTGIGPTDDSEQSNSSWRKRPHSEAFPVIKVTSNSRTSADRGKTPKHLFWVNDRIFVYIGERYTCYKCEHGVLKEKYHIISARKWKAWETWYQADHPIPGFKKKIGALLCTLSGNTINLYFLDTGERYYQEIKLDGNVKFSEIIPSEEMGKLVVPCIKTALSPDLHFDAILVDVLDPLKSLRLQIQKIATGKRHPEHVSCYDNLLQFDFRDCVQIWDLIEIISSSCRVRDTPLPNVNEGIPVSHVISQLRVPFVLFHLKKNRAFSLGLYPLPLQYINEGSVYDIRTQQALPVMNNQPYTLSELQYQTVLTEEVDGSVAFHPDGTSRVIFCAKNIFCGASIRQVELDGDFQGSELVQDVYMKFNTQQPSNSASSTTAPVVEGRRRSARVPTRVKYVEDEESNARITYANAHHIDALVIMEVTSDPPNFKFHFYDSKSWNKMLTVVPKSQPERKIPSEELSTFTFNVTEAEIMVANISKNPDTIFVISLLNEVGVIEDSSPTNQPPSFKYPNWIRNCGQKQNTRK